MKIGFDFDGVLGDSHPLKPMIARQMFGVDIPAMRFERKWVVPEFLTVEQYEAVGRELFFGEHQISPVKDAVFYTRLLLRDKHTLSIITSRSDKSLDIAKGLLVQYKIDLSVVGVGYGVSKADACRGLDVYLDDDLRKLIPLVGIVPHLFLFSWPQNLEDQVPKEIVRVGDWYEFYQQIKYDVFV